jgi:DNA recombination protein RmuC
MNEIYLTELIIGTGAGTVLFLGWWCFSLIKTKKSLNNELRHKEDELGEASCALQNELLALARCETELRLLREEKAQDSRELSSLQQRLEALSLQSRSLEISLAEATQRNTLKDEHIADVERVLSEAKTNLSDTFTALSHHALRENSKYFSTFLEQYLKQAEAQQKSVSTQSEEVLTSLGKSLQQRLSEVEGTVRDFEKRRSEADAEFRTRLSQFHELGQKVGSEASRLTESLRSSRVQGTWGEHKLRQVVEAAGMDSFCDFDEQSTLSNDSRLRPDMVVRLASGLKVVIDAKAPITTYLSVLEASSDNDRDSKLRDLVKVLKGHIKNISERGYTQQIEGCLDYVLVFIPIESIFFLAVEREEALLEYATGHKVLLVTPLSLIAFLRSIAMGWHDRQVNEGVTELFELGGQLYQRIVKVLELTADLGQNLNKSLTSFNKMTSSLNTRLMPCARKFESLKVGASKGVAEVKLIDSLSKTPYAINHEQSNGTISRVELDDSINEFLNDECSTI